MLFENKIALVTGSGRGIGRGIALNFASQGADVVINFFRNRAPAEQTMREVEAMGRRALLVTYPSKSLARFVEQGTQALKISNSTFDNNSAGNGGNRDAVSWRMIGFEVRG